MPLPFFILSFCAVSAIKPTDSRPFDTISHTRSISCTTRLSSGWAMHCRRASREKLNRSDTA